MKRKTKSYSLSLKAIEKIENTKKQHEFSSASEALEYILLYQPDESKVKDLVYNTIMTIMSENTITFSGNNKTIDVKASVDNEMQKLLQSATDDIFATMPD